MAHRPTSRSLQAMRSALSQEDADRSVDLQEVLDPAGMAGSWDNDLCLRAGVCRRSGVLATYLICQISRISELCLKGLRLAQQQIRWRIA